MATYTLTSGRAAYEKTLTANTVDTVNLGSAFSEVEVISDGAASIFFTVDGSIPTVGGASTYYLPAAATSRSVPVRGGSAATVKLISSGTPLYSVIGS